MLEQLKLVRRADLAAVDEYETDVLSLLDWLADQGYAQSTGDGVKLIDEVITLHIRGETNDDLTAIDDLAENVQALDTKLCEIGYSKDRLAQLGVWLRAQLEGETGARQAYLLAAKRSPGINVADPLLDSENVLKAYQLGITRMPAWESTESTNIYGANIPADGGTILYSLDGDLPARVARARLYQFFGTIPTYEFWIGAKSSKENEGITLSNFAPKWHLHAAGIFGDDTTGGTSHSDANALDNYKAVCTFATETGMVPRVTMKVSEATGYPADQRGRYAAILRGRITDTLVARARIGYGFPTGTFAITRPNGALIENLTPGYTMGFWHYMLGFVSIPPFANPLALDYASLQIEAEKISGSGNLELDAIELVPADHLFHFVSGTGVSGTPDLTYAEIYSRPDGKLNGVAYYQSVTPNSAIEQINPDQNDWRLPVGDGAVVLVANTVYKSNDYNLSLDCYQRYSTLRGDQ